MARLGVVLETAGRWTTVVVWAFAIIALSSVPNYFPASNPGDLNFDKAVHFVEYFVLGALVVAAAMRSNTTLPAWAFACGSIVAVAAFGVGDELYQHMVPGRDTNIYDWAADVVGATLGALSAAHVLSYNSRCSGR